MSERPVAEEVLDAAERARVCDQILRALPAWFGLEHAVVQYVETVRALETFAVREAGKAVGFVSLKRHTPQAAELYVMGVLTDRHRRGIGATLVAAAEERLRRDRVVLFQVKTLGASRPNEIYARTRSFYEAVGFLPLEELHGLWDPGNPCLLMVKCL